MAELNMEISVDVTASLHKAMADVALLMFDEYGIRVLSVNFDWHPTGFGERHAKLTRISIDTETNPKNV